MEQFWAKLADQPLWLETRWPYTSEIFENYKIFPTEAEKQQYKALMQENGSLPFEPLRTEDAEIAQVQAITPEAPHGYPEYYLESLVFYQKIADLLMGRDTLVLHCTSLEMDDRAYLFTAPSGTGKSTHARLWRQVFGGRVTMINDDKPLVRRQADGSWRVYGTPYGGKDNLQTNTSAKICGIVLLERGTENKIWRVDAHDAYLTLMAQTYHTIRKPEALLHAMDLVGSLANLPVYRLQCTISEEAARVAYEALKGETT